MSEEMMGFTSMVISDIAMLAYELNYFVHNMIHA